MKSIPHGLLKAALLLFVTIILFLASPIIGNGQYFQLPGTFLYSINTRHNQVFDISPDGKIAIALTTDPVSSQSAFLTTFDPILGTEFDHKSFGFGQSTCVWRKWETNYGLWSLPAKVGHAKSIFSMLVLLVN